MQRLEPVAKSFICLAGIFQSLCGRVHYRGVGVGKLFKNELTEHDATAAQIKEVDRFVWLKGQYRGYGVEHAL